MQNTTPKVLPKPMIRRDNPIFMDAKLNACKAKLKLKKIRVKTQRYHDNDSRGGDNGGNHGKCSVPILPSLFPLQVRNTLKLSDAISIEKIVSQMVSFLQSNSIHYSCDKVNGRFHCRSSLNTVEFVIQLWRTGYRSSNKHNNNNNGIQAKPKQDDVGSSKSGLIVEMQRLQGCRFKMVQIRKGLFHVLKGGGAATVEPGKNEMSAKQQVTHNNMSRQNAQRQRLPHHNCQSKTKSSSSTVKESMEISLRLLESTRMDEVQIGMESLAATTDSALAQPEHANFVSRELLLGRTGSLGERIRSHVLRYVPTTNAPKTRAQPQQRLQQNRERGGTDCYYDLLRMQSLSLRVCANAIRETNADGDCSAAKIHAGNLNYKSSIIKRLTEIFVENLEMARQRPEEAALSAKCLRLLLDRGFEPQEVGRIFTEHALKTAIQQGVLPQSPLEKECRRLMESMGKKQ